MQKELAIAKKLALDAGAVLIDHYERNLSVDWKAPGDPVT